MSPSSSQPRIQESKAMANPFSLAHLRAGLSRMHPRLLVRNPVMFVTEIGALLTTLAAVQVLVTGGEGLLYTVLLSVVLWATVWFATWSEALAEARGQAQAASLRATRQDVPARRLATAEADPATAETVNASALRAGDLVVVAAGETIPADGEVINGAATVDESAITGESAPVIRESGGDRSSVTGGTRVLSDQIIVRILAGPGEGFLDRMISMIEGASRQKTPNEIALTILLAGFTLAFILVCVTLYPIGTFFGLAIPITTLVALLVCLIPTTIGGMLSAIGIAGMSRLAAQKVLATSGRAVEAAGDVDVLLLDKTGTITLGNRRATAFHPAPGVAESELAEAAQWASLADETPEGRSIVVLAKEQHGLRGRPVQGATAVPFTAATRMSGIDLGERQLRKGAAEAVAEWLTLQSVKIPDAVMQRAHAVADGGGTPLVVADQSRALGVIELKDVVKGGIRERFAELRAMGIKTVMITGDNPRTATAIAAEAGVDDVLAEATPEMKLAMIRRYQAEGHLVAMTGDGTNDAPALAQADVAVAMNSGTQAAKEAANMVDLDSDPTKLITVVSTGKQLLMTRGALTTFSLANDVAKYFAILPAIFLGAMPYLAPLNIMGLSSPQSAILSAVIFNALIIPALIPLALRGVAYRPWSADRILNRNLALYGLGGLILPFVGIKAIDLVITAIGIA